MKKIIAANQKTAAVIIICITVGILTMSFRDFQFGPLQHYDTLYALPDSIPQGKQHKKMTMRDYDRLVKEFTTDLKKFTEDLHQLNNEKIAASVNDAVNQLKTGEVIASIERAIKETDFAAIEEDIRNAFKETGWEQMNTEISASLKHAKETMEKIDMTAIRAELTRAKKELEAGREAIQKIDFSSIQKEVQEGIQKAGNYLKEQKAMFNEMESDGLINQKKGFSIDYKKGNLYINGKKQPDSVVEKYRHYFNDNHYRIEIEKE